MARSVIPRTQGNKNRRRIDLQDCSAPFDKTNAVKLPVIFKVKNKWGLYVRVTEINRCNLSYSLADAYRLGSKPLTNEGRIAFTVFHYKNTCNSSVCILIQEAFQCS